MKISNLQHCINDKILQNQFIDFMKYEHNVNIYFNHRSDAQNELTVVGRTPDVINSLKIMFKNNDWITM